MPIKWSAVKVSQAVDLIEMYVNQAAGPLESARAAAREATQIPDVPGYIADCLRRLTGEIERTIGGSTIEPVGRLRAGIDSIRGRIPHGAIEAEQAQARHGSQQSLM